MSDLILGVGPNSKLIQSRKLRGNILPLQVYRHAPDHEDRTISSPDSPLFVMRHSRETQQFARRPCIDHHPPLRSARSHPTVRCITALRRHTRQPWELIVVDDGSTDETSAYLASVQDAAPVPVTVIADATSRGLPAAINHGLRTASGEYLVVLKNDVVVTDGWLGQLIALANAKGEFTSEHAEHA